MKINPVKGCLDYMPKETELRQQIIEKILKTYKNNGFLQIKTPILENLENLTNGDAGDNVKLMFKTVKRGAKLQLDKPNLKEEDVIEEGLRYDLTVPLARFFTRFRNDLPFPFKSIQIDDSFRAEKPQVGRNRQLTQCDIDIWGVSGILGEIEIITTTMEAYYNLGLKNVVCKISSRKILTAIILNAGIDESRLNDVCVVVDKLDKISIYGVKQELLNIGIDEYSVQKLINAITSIQENGVDCLTTFGANKSDVEEMKELLIIVKPFIPETYDIKFDISIVRGQGYYTGCVFEMYYLDSGYSFAIGGGGRYDKMYGKFAGNDVPAVGYGLGLDRVVLILNGMQNNLIKSKKLALIYSDESIEEIIAKLTDEMLKHAAAMEFERAAELRDKIKELEKLTEK